MYGAKGVTICKEWESFQAFAQWFVDECIKLGVDPMINDLALDKDTRIKGTKIYAPHTCSLITQSENSKAIAKTYEFISPDGEHVVITNLHQYCKDNNMNQSNMSQLYSGKRKSVKGWTRVK